MLKTLFTLLYAGFATLANANFDFSSYKPSTIQEIVAERRSDFSNLPRMPDMAISGAIFKYSVTVPFSRQLRQITPERSEFIRNFGASHQVAGTFVDQFKSEFLVQHDGRNLWVPIQHQLLVPLGKEVPTGNPVDLYIVFAGFLKSEPIFLATEFKTKKSSEQTAGNANNTASNQKDISELLSNKLKGKRFTYLQKEQRFLELPKMKGVSDVTWKLKDPEGITRSKGLTLFAFILRRPGYDKPVSENLLFLLAKAIDPESGPGDSRQYEMLQVLGVDAGLHRKGAGIFSNTTNISRALDIGGDGAWPVCTQLKGGDGIAPIVVLHATYNAKQPYQLHRAWRVDLASESLVPVGIENIRCVAQQPF